MSLTSVRLGHSSSGSGGGGLLDLATDLATDLDAEETPRCTTATLCVGELIRFGDG